MNELQEKMKEQEKREKEKQDAIKAFHEKLYEQEGETIFGDFYFGMSKSNFDLIRNKIRDATSGYVKIGDIDMFVDNSAQFYNDSLYSMILSKDVGRMENEIGIKRKYYTTAYNNVEQLINKLSKKYGDPAVKELEDKEDLPEKNHAMWDLKNKRIIVEVKKEPTVLESRYFSTTNYTLYIRFENKSIMTEAAQEENRKYTIRKAKQDSIKKEQDKLKESFASGL